MRRRTSASGSEQAAQLLQKAAKAKRCDDLYTVVKGLPVSLVTRPDPAPQGALPKDIALALAGLDIGETTVLTRGAGQELVMLCSREATVDEAKGEADKIVGEARTKAERLESESKSKADKVESDARTRAQMLDSETAERRTQLFGDLEKERDKLSADVDNLRSFEREYRSRLKSYFTQQLEALDNGSEETGGPTEEPPAPKRLRSILGEDESK